MALGGRFFSRLASSFVDAARRFLPTLFGFSVFKPAARSISYERQIPFELGFDVRIAYAVAAPDRRFLLPLRRFAPPRTIEIALAGKAEPKRAARPTRAKPREIGPDVAPF